MKTTLVLILILFSATFTLWGQVTFSHASISNAKSQASSSNLPYFVYISGDWCLPCQIMEETTFKSLDLQDAIDQKYTAYKVDFHSEEGAEWVSAHDICCLPTFVFFDENGNKTQQIQSPLTASGFIKVLDSPPSYSKQNKEFASANSSERLKSQISSPPEEINNKENSSQQNTTNFIVGAGNYSEQVDAPTANTYISPDKADTYSIPNTIETIDIESKSDFLNNLHKHITSLEALYAQYELEADNTRKLNNVSPLAKMEGFVPNESSKSSCECENITKTTQELAQTINELKAWEAQLGTLTNNTKASLINIAPPTNEHITTPSASFVSNSTDASAAYYSVQMGLFKTEAYARRMVDDLAKNYTYSIEMKTIEKSGSVLHRVLLGPFMYETEAKEAYSKMKKDNRKAVVGIF